MESGYPVIDECGASGSSDTLGHAYVKAIQDPVPVRSCDQVNEPLEVLPPRFKPRLRRGEGWQALLVIVQEEHVAYDGADQSRIPPAWSPRCLDLVLDTEPYRIEADSLERRYRAVDSDSRLHVDGYDEASMTRAALDLTYVKVGADSMSDAIGKLYAWRQTFDQEVGLTALRDVRDDAPSTPPCAVSGEAPSKPLSKKILCEIGSLGQANLSVFADQFAPRGKRHDLDRLPESFHEVAAPKPLPEGLELRSIDIWHAAHRDRGLDRKRRKHRVQTVVYIRLWRGVAIRTAVPTLRMNPRWGSLLVTIERWRGTTAGTGDRGLAEFPPCGDFPRRWNVKGFSSVRSVDEDAKTTLLREFDHVRRTAAIAVPDRDEAVGVLRHLLVADRSSALSEGLPIRRKALHGQAALRRPEFAFPVSPRRHPRYYGRDEVSPRTRLQCATYSLGGCVPGAGDDYLHYLINPLNEV